MPRSTLAFAMLGGLLVSGAAQAEMVKYHAAMSTSSEVPPKTTAGKGTFDGTLDTTTKVLTYDVSYADLTGPATAAHLHGPAAVGANAGILVPFPAPLASPIHGTVTLTDAQIAEMNAGQVYANVHTAANPGGEIRGQVSK